MANTEKTATAERVTLRGKHGDMAFVKVTDSDGETLLGGALAERAEAVIVFRHRSGVVDMDLRASLDKAQDEAASLRTAAMNTYAVRISN